MYCERCRRIVEGEKCPECGKACVRDVRDGDLCLLYSGGQIWADMACDILRQENVPFIREGTLGAAMAVLTGLSAETFNIFVPFSSLETARELTLAVFPQPGAEEEEILYDDGPETETETEEE